MKEAQLRGVTLPSDWSVRRLLEELREAMMDVRPAVLKTAASLRHRGTKTSTHLHTNTHSSGGQRVARGPNLALKH